MKIAMFRSLAFDYTTPFDHPPMTDGYVQVSGWIDVDFPPLTADEQRVADELVALNKRQQSFEADFRRQRKALEAEREALLKTGT